MPRLRTLSVVPLVAALLVAGCTSAPATSPSPANTPAGSPATEAPSPAAESLTVYSGRSQELVGPLLEQFEQQSGTSVEVRYGDTAELASLLLEEGANTPADVYIAQDAGALGAVAEEGMFTELPQEVLGLVPEPFRSPEGEWVGLSGRARVVVYDTRELSEEDLPDSIEGFTDPAWNGRIGWAPTNGSFQAFVTAYRQLRGDDAAREWLEGIQANQPTTYEGNTPIVQAVADGEIDVGFVNHYYLLRQYAEQGQDFPVANYYLSGDDPGALVNVAGAGVLAASQRQEVALELIEFLLSEESQSYFASETFEYPLIEGVEPPAGAPALSELQTPELDLSQLADLQGTIRLLQEAGVLP